MLKPLLALLIAFSCLAEDADAQRRRKKKSRRQPAPSAKADWRIDPYTENDPLHFKKVGIQRIGQFDWVDDHTTEDIARLSGGVPLRCMETKHFRIASTIGYRDIPGTSEERNELYAEIGKIREHLPKIPKRPRTIDPWLHMHLYAQRMESIYEEFSKLAGVTDDKFPQNVGGTLRTRSWGVGPFLGRPDKFTLLMFESEAQLVRYLQQYAGRNEKVPVRHYYEDSDAFGYITAADAHNGVLKDDKHLYASIRFGMAQNLLDAYRQIDFQGMPVWLREGMAHCFRRDYAPECNNFSFFDDKTSDKFKAWQWRAKVYNRVKFDIDTPMLDIFHWSEPWKLTINEHAFLWARVDFLRSMGEEKFSKLLNRVEEYPLNLKALDRDQVLRWHDLTFKEAYGWDAATFDKLWHEWVLKEYAPKTK